MLYLCLDLFCFVLFCFVLFCFVLLIIYWWRCQVGDFKYLETVSDFNLSHYLSLSLHFILCFFLCFSSVFFLFRAHSSSSLIFPLPWPLPSPPHLSSFLTPHLPYSPLRLPIQSHPPAQHTTSYHHHTPYNLSILISIPDSVRQSLCMYVCLFLYSLSACLSVCP